MAGAHGQAALSEVQAFTKWVPQPGPITRQIVADSIDRSLRRMDVDCLDLLQFHWWDYQDKRYLDALEFLAELRDQGRIHHLALTNFDTQHMREITDQGIPIASNQVQYSLIDRRPQAQMTALCLERQIWLLPYGVLCGGLLSDRYLGRPEPNRAALNTASLRKYKQMVDAWGGWELFQLLLTTLRTIADKQSVSIANVAVRCILDQTAVAGVIIGTRLGLSEHVAENARVFTFQLDDDDLSAIEAVLANSRNLSQIIGDCGDEYRRRF